MKSIRLLPGPVDIAWDCSCISVTSPSSLVAESPLAEHSAAKFEAGIGRNGDIWMAMPGPTQDDRVMDADAPRRATAPHDAYPRRRAFAQAATLAAP
jgi:hypothetical protein